MAQYKHSKYLSKSEVAAFDEIHSPGVIAANSGIYRCEGCGREDCCNKGNPLPPQNHHQHSQAHGSIRWRMIVWADPTEK